MEDLKDLTVDEMEDVIYAHWASQELAESVVIKKMAREIAEVTDRLYSQQDDNSLAMSKIRYLTNIINSMNEIWK